MEYIWRSAKEILGVSRWGSGGLQEAWWWNEEVPARVKEKQDIYTTITGSRSDGEKEVNVVKYDEAKKIAKKAITLAMNNAHERLYMKLETNEEENDVFKLARARDKKTRDLGFLWCIKGDDDKVLVDDAKIKERSGGYFSKLFNGELSEYSRRNERGL